MEGQEGSFGDQTVHPFGLAHSREAISHLSGFFRLRHGCHLIRGFDAYCFGIGLYGGYL